MKYHPIADLFPLLDDDALQSLAADIQEHGLIEPVWTYEGQILDGRNRYRACKLAGVKPRYQEYEGDTPLQFVISKNIQRRDMTSWQRAFVALEALPVYQEEAKKRMLAGVKADPNQKFDEGMATDIVARIFKTNRMYVHAAARLKADHPELVEAAVNGVLTYSGFIKLKHEERDELKQVAEDLAQDTTVDAGEDAPHETCSHNGTGDRSALCASCPIASMSIDELSELVRTKIKSMLDDDSHDDKPPERKPLPLHAAMPMQAQEAKRYRVTYRRDGEARTSLIDICGETNIEPMLRRSFPNSELEILDIVCKG